MGNIRSRQIPVSDASINTDVSFQFTQSVVLKELNDIKDKIQDVDSRLFKTETATDLTLRRLEEHEACSMKLIETYRRLVFDVKAEKDRTIEKLEKEIAFLKDINSMSTDV